jgi:uncharacterized RDD family membrane protein YckC
MVDPVGPQQGQPYQQYQPYPPQTYGAQPFVPVQPAAGAALQPYSPAGAPVPYAQPYAQPYGYPPAASYHLVSAGGRFGAALLDVLLMVVTLWIGWFIWSLITWGDGQTPAKKMLGHVVADANTGEAFDWGRMALREFCIRVLLGNVLSLVTIGIYPWIDAFMVFGDRQRTLHDRMADSIVRHA